MDSMCFRHADFDDANSIGALHVASWRETYRGMLPDELLDGLSAESRSEMWRSVLSGPVNWDGTSVFVAENRCGIHGFGACGVQRDENLRKQGFDAEIGAIYVLQAQQSAGVGTRLMHLMARSLRGAGRKAAILWVLRDNFHARGFYERLGGTLIGERIEDFSGAALVEVAYGWSNLVSLLGKC